MPHVRRPGERDTDTMDTFVDSSWYFLRYRRSQPGDAPFDPEQAREWLPVDQYVGGVTHAILHLLYAASSPRCCTTWVYVDFVEPFTRLLNQGMVGMDGSAMSKSRGNLVRLSDELSRPRRGRHPPEHGLRRAARGRHRLGRRVGRRVAQVPVASMAAVW